MNGTPQGVPNPCRDVRLICATPAICSISRPGCGAAQFLFLIGKVFWFLCAPSHVLVEAVIAAAVLLYFRRYKQAQTAAIAAAALFVIAGAIPSYIWLLRPIEDSVPVVAMPRHIDGILTISAGRGYRSRLIDTYILARRHPEARVVFSGGAGTLVPGDEPESKEAQEFLLSLGLSPARLQLESRSRNTLENIAYSHDMIRPKPGEVWVLVTAAFQMPRALDAADHVKWKILPYQTDRMTPKHGLTGYFHISENLVAFDNAMRESVALLVYS